MHYPTHPAFDLTLPGAVDALLAFHAARYGDARMENDETSTEPPAAGEASDGEAPSDEGDKTFTQADLDKVLRERVARERAKYADYASLKAKAEEFDKAEAAKKTAEQLQAEALAEAERVAANARAEVVTYRAAATYQIGPDDLHVLAGDGSEEAVMARAERLGQLLAAERELAELKARASGQPPASGRPFPVLRPGASEVPVDLKPSAKDSMSELLAARGWTANQQ